MGVWDAGITDILQLQIVQHMLRELAAQG